MELLPDLNSVVSLFVFVSRFFNNWRIFGRGIWDWLLVLLIAALAVEIGAGLHQYFNGSSFGGRR
jgi:hypothetical protein